MIMRTCLAIAIVVVVTPIAMGVSLAEERGREAELRIAIEAFGRAFREADVQGLERLLSDDYVHVNGGSGNVIGRDDWLEWVAARRAEIDSGELLITEYRVEDLSIVFHGNTAIAVGAVFSSQVRNGTSSTLRIRFSNTWLYEDSTWRRAAFHDSAIP
jgi:ketosteroid isomerase-like protein